MRGQDPNFSELIERAQNVTTDIASPFPMPGTGRTAFQPGRAPGVPDLDYQAHVCVFNLPNDSDGYEEVLNQCLRGEAIIRFEEKTFDKDGNFLVALCYMTPRERVERPAEGEPADREPAARHGRVA